MDDAALLLRIRVVLVSTRAAVRGLGPSHAQVPEVLRRGLDLLDDLDGQILLADGTGPEVADRMSEARAELISLAKASGDGTEAD